MRTQLEWDLIRDKVAAQCEVNVEEEDVLNEARGVVARHSHSSVRTHSPTRSSTSMLRKC